MKWGDTRGGLHVTHRAATVLWGFLGHSGYTNEHWGALVTDAEGWPAQGPHKHVPKTVRPTGQLQRSRGGGEGGGRSACGLQAAISHTRAGPAASATAGTLIAGRLEFNAALITGR